MLKTHTESLPMTFKIPISFAKIVCSALLKLCFSFQATGREHLKKLDGPVILAGNHTGLLDGPIVVASMNHPFRFLMSTEVFTWGLIGKLMPFCNIIPIHVGKPLLALRTALQQLARQQSICIFPEGKLSENGELNAFNPGVALLHEKSGVPIVPFAIRGGFEAWPIGQRLPRIYPVSIRYGEPILPGTFHSRELLLIELEKRIQSLNQKCTNLINSKKEATELQYL